MVQVANNFLPAPDAEGGDAAAASLRFKVGDQVQCRTGAQSWARGTVVKLFHREDHFPAGKSVPYQVQLESGERIYAPQDTDFLIRKA